ncbi:hypothetical protein LNP26_27190 [Klebsiella variicola subsp. variicola]|nr:hypothetical protein [Klebsiella variicola subsp. variicola]
MGLVLGAKFPFSNTSDAIIPPFTPVAQYSGIWSADKYYDLTCLPVRVGDQLTFSVLPGFQDAGAKFHIFWRHPLVQLFVLNRSLLWVTRYKHSGYHRCHSIRRILRQDPEGKYYGRDI